MGRLRLLVISMFFIPFAVIAQDYVNIDKKTAEQVMLNTAIQKGIEELHNVQIDTIKKKQNKLMALTATLATYKELYKLTLENAKGFGVESGVYKSIITKCGSIAKRTVSASDAVMKTNFTGKAIAAFHVYELAIEAAHLGNLFFNIVTNGAVKNPISLPGSNDQKDKLNLLNRHERMSMAMKINDELSKIEGSLVMIEWYCKYNTFSNLLMHIDRETWITYTYSQISTKRLIEKWNQIKD